MEDEYEKRPQILVKPLGGHQNAGEQHQLSLACLYYWRSKLRSGLAPPSVPVLTEPSTMVSNSVTSKYQGVLSNCTGTGKTFIAFQLAWKLFQSRWKPATTTRNVRSKPK